MGIGASIFLITVGAIMVWGIDANLDVVELSTIGWILMVVGAVAGMASLIMGRRRGETVVRDRRPE